MYTKAKCPYCDFTAINTYWLEEHMKDCKGFVQGK